MTKFYINPVNIDKLMHQNGAECVECVEGCLQDNGLYTTKNGGLMAVYEHYINCWCSDLLIEFSRKEPEKTAIYNNFMMRMEAAL